MVALLVSGATVDVSAYPSCGVLVTPRNGNSIEGISRSGRLWAADNDAFGAWDQERFWSMVVRISRAERSRFLWVVCPDVVGDAQGTINHWLEWYPQLSYLGLPAAFVGQNGLESIADQIPWAEMAAFFVGGDTKWKLSYAAELLAAEAKARGKWVHVGRVNTLKRIRHAIDIGADSIDGGGFSRWPKRISMGVRWIAQHKRELAECPMLF